MLGHGGAHGTYSISTFRHFNITQILLFQCNTLILPFDRSIHPSIQVFYPSDPAALAAASAAGSKRSKSSSQPSQPHPSRSCPFGVLPVQEASSDMDIAEECMETVLSYLQVVGGRGRDPLLGREVSSVVSMGER